MNHGDCMKIFVTAINITLWEVAVLTECVTIYQRVSDHVIGKAIKFASYLRVSVSIKCIKCIDSVTIKRTLNLVNGNSDTESG